MPTIAAIGPFVPRAHGPRRGRVGVHGVAPVKVLSAIRLVRVCTDLEKPGLGSQQTVFRHVLEVQEHVDLVHVASGERLLGLFYGRQVCVVVTAVQIPVLVRWHVLQRIRGHETVGVAQEQRVRQLLHREEFDL